MKREVKGLAPHAAQLLVLLQIRTTGDAQPIVQTTRAMYLEASSDLALDRAWKSLEQRFQMNKNPLTTDIRPNTRLYNYNRLPECFCSALQKTP